jgi:hypothetical protein
LRSYNFNYIGSELRFVAVVRERDKGLHYCKRRARGRCPGFSQRKLGRSLTFISVVELQGNGNPHLHLLIGSYLPKQWISSAWQALGGGWATRIESADLHRVAAYLAKYLTADSLRDLPPRTRRFSSSKGLALFDRSKGDGAWLLLKTTIEILRESALAVISEEFETEADGARSLAAFTADQVPSHLAERLSTPLERRRA